MVLYYSRRSTLFLPGNKPDASAPSPASLDIQGEAITTHFPERHPDIVVCALWAAVRIVSIDGRRNILLGEGLPWTSKKGRQNTRRQPCFAGANMPRPPHQPTPRIGPNVLMLCNEMGAYWATTYSDGGGHVTRHSARMTEGSTPRSRASSLAAREILFWAVHVRLRRLARSR